METPDHAAFGPVPSRRLGRSLGINNIPPKVCSYSCAYCQLGRAIKMQSDRQPFYDPEWLSRDVHDKVERASRFGESIDYLTFVPDGEPTLDVNLGREIDLVKGLGIKTAVISNGSLLSREDVREDLLKVDWVSVKVDAVREDVWRRIDRPHRSLRLSSILRGMLEFADTYRGHLATETMLVRGVNDHDDVARETAGFLKRLGPATAHVSIPTRPPAKSWAVAPSEETVNRVCQIFSGHVDNLEYLIGYEGNAFAFTGNIEEDLLGIAAVHPMREEAVEELLARAGSDWSIVQALVAQGTLVETTYDGRKFYIRKLKVGPDDTRPKR